VKKSRSVCHDMEMHRGVQPLYTDLELSICSDVFFFQLIRNACGINSALIMF
jgi:hypothetical protein